MIKIHLRGSLHPPGDSDMIVASVSLPRRQGNTLASPAALLPKSHINLLSWSFCTRGICRQAAEQLREIPRRPSQFLRVVLGRIKRKRA